MSVDNPEQKYSIEEVMMFLCGEAMLDGRWFGSIHKDRPVFWWRKHLRAAVDGYKAQASKDLVRAGIEGARRYRESLQTEMYANSDNAVTLKDMDSWFREWELVQRRTTAVKGYKLDEENLNEQ